MTFHLQKLLIFLNLKCKVNNFETFHIYAENKNCGGSMIKMWCIYSTK